MASYGVPLVEDAHAQTSSREEGTLSLSQDLEEL